MGKCETVDVSIGISILIKDLLEAMTEDNYETIRDNFLQDGSLINDDNNSYNTAYDSIISGENLSNDDYLELNELKFTEYIDYLSTQFKKFGDKELNRNGTSKFVEYKEGDEENLYHQTLLVPHCKLVQTERWGWSREGTNGTCTNLDIDKLVTIKTEISDKMEKLNVSDKLYSVSFIVSQHSG